MSYRSVFKPDLFAGKNIIVTGGGSGIGRCTAHELASLGARVVLIGRKRMSKAEEFVMGDISVKLVRALENAAVLVVTSP